MALGDGPFVHLLLYNWMASLWVYKDDAQLQRMLLVNRRWRASPFPPSPPHVLYFAVWCISWSYSITVRQPCGLVPTKLASQAWTSVLACYTGHPVGDQCQPGACRLLQRSWIAKPGPVSWLWYTGHPVVVSGTSWCHHCRGVWVLGHRPVGYSCPLPPFAANQSTNECYACIAFGGVPS